MKQFFCLFATLFLVSGCDVGETGNSATVSPAPSETVAVSRCEAYPIERAEELITNADTGERKLKGKIVATAAVKSKDTFVGGNGQNVPIYIIAFNVDGQVVTLLLGSDSATGPGMYSAVDEFSSIATGFPQNNRIGGSSTEGVAEAQLCVTQREQTKDSD
jgi:hypothetical protein